MLTQSANTCFYRKTGWIVECLVVCFLTGYNITERSWLFLCNVGSGVHLRLAGQQWTKFDITWKSDIVYDQPTNESFCKKQESFPYNAALAITGVIKETSREKLYEELGIESIKLRKKLRRVCTFYKIKTTGLPSYLFRLMPKTIHPYQGRTMDNVTKYQCRTEAFKSFFFPWMIS